MSPSNLTSPVRTIVCGALIGGALALAASTSANAAGTATVADCPGVDLAPTAANSGEIRAGHSSDMVRGGFFAHTAADGDTFVDRILAAGYAKRTAGWSRLTKNRWITVSDALDARYAPTTEDLGHRLRVERGDRDTRAATSRKHRSHRRPLLPPRGVGSRSAAQPPSRAPRSASSAPSTPAQSRSSTRRSGSLKPTTTHSPSS